MALGYDDTPILADSGYHVHDGNRPQPPVVVSGTESFGDLPPSDAIVLFNGASLAAWSGGNGAAEWKIENGTMEVVPKTGDITTLESFGNIQLHIEWMSPIEVKGDGQGRGNSGVFLMDRYEIQVLDCYNNPTYADGTTGGIYGQYPPLVNACRRPGEWQAYDILWEVPHWNEEGSLISPAYITVLHNGVLLHHHKALQGATGHRNIPGYTPHGDAPIRLQDHGDLVRYRNIWVRRLKDYDHS